MTCQTYLRALRDKNVVVPYVPCVPYVSKILACLTSQKFRRALRGILAKKLEVPSMLYMVKNWHVTRGLKI